jgi:amidase
MPITDSVDAFVAHGLVERAPTGEGPLSDLIFALKDLFDLEGVKTGFGSPEWLATHDAPTRTAPAAQRLLDAGARLVGKTHTDEMAWSLNGENAHYGAPVNVAAPGRIPGGSSSGSVAATAAGLVDFAVGSDTGGSVRLPASYCGVYGLRPTHGRISLEGAAPLAPSYDTVGWFARDPELLRRVGRVLLDPANEAPAPTRLLVADDLFAKADAPVRAALQPSLDRLVGLFGGAEHVIVQTEIGMAWREIFRLIQSGEAWAAHADWVRVAKPAFGPGVKERFEAASRLSGAELDAARAARERARARMEELVGAGIVLALPTSPGVAPLRKTPEPTLNEFRGRALELLCCAGHAGMPQISLPLAKVDGLPVGLSIIAARGCDEALLDLAVRMGRP